MVLIGGEFRQEMLALGKDGDLIIPVAVKTNARHPEISGFKDDRLVIKVASRPVDGAANKELCARIAKLCGVSKSKVTIIAGEQSRRKRVSVRGITGCHFRDLVEQALQEHG